MSVDRKGAPVEPNPEVGAPFEEVGSETWEVSEGPSLPYNQGEAQEPTCFGPCCVTVVEVDDEEE
ncbi:hypothetical protein BDA96_10G233900 [Sorghum bicolor]|uniref:Uncharacterized protein n=1 Tax=Sorghum bicolor TaxID=4558 RepID=A0A921Q5W6_SORBI|nr:hypothetical protein BDA96_10G233900 [Sorghum bicolor]